MNNGHRTTPQPQDGTRKDPGATVTGERHPHVGLDVGVRPFAGHEGGKRRLPTILPSQRRAPSPGDNLGLQATLRSPKYRTIVADPPWFYGASRGFSWREGRPSGTRGPMLAYQTMTVDEIAELPVSSFAERDAHLYVWTTQRYLWDARMIAEAWGFEPSTLLTWCKAPTGFSLGGTFGKSSEFVLFARRGKLRAKTRTNRDWWQWPRGEHSAKPEAFLDLVEQVSPGPYLEMFARRNRLGWDTWGNESLEHVELVS